MSTELTDAERLYENAPMSGRSHDACLRYFRDVQNQALEVAAVKLEDEGKLHSVEIVRALKHPKVDADKTARVERVLSALLAVHEAVDYEDADAYPNMATLVAAMRLHYRWQLPPEPEPEEVKEPEQAKPAVGEFAILRVITPEGATLRWFPTIGKAESAAMAVTAVKQTGAVASVLVPMGDGRLLVDSELRNN